jgi:hypothetical protein
MAIKLASSVEQFLESLAHPFKPDIQKLRKLILSLDPGIKEAVKWNAPSFYTGEHFATMRLSGRPQLQLILHMGTKKNEMPADAIQDPHKILKWLGPDRACVDFASLGSVDASGQALKDILQQWLQHIPVAQAEG